MAHFLSVVGFGLQVAAGEIVHLHSSGKLVYRFFFSFLYLNLLPGWHLFCRMNSVIIILFLFYEVGRSMNVNSLLKVK